MQIGFQYILDMESIFFFVCKHSPWKTSDSIPDIASHVSEIHKLDKYYSLLLYTQ